MLIPAAYGRNQRTGNDLVRAYQVAGGDATRPIPTWSLFNTAKIVGAATTGERFDGIPPGYTRSPVAASRKARPSRITIRAI